MKIGLRGGHSPNCKGAMGFLDEQAEVRKIYNEMVPMLQAAGHTVINCNSDASTMSGELSQGTDKANVNGCEFYITIHMNASNGAGNGVECWLYDVGNGELNSMADRICNNFASKGFQNRGKKYSTRYHDLNASSMPAIIVETLFCDNQRDVSLYNQIGMKGVAELIARGITGKKVSVAPPTSTVQPVKRKNVHLYEFNGGLNQQWKSQVDKDGYMKLTCAGNGLCLDVDGAGKKNGTNVQVYTSNDTSAQRWKEKIIEKGDEEKGTCCVELIPKHAQDMRLDCKDGKLGNNTNVQLYKANGTDAQRWYKRLVGGKYIVYVNVNSGRVLDGGGKI